MCCISSKQNSITCFWWRWKRTVSHWFLIFGIEFRFINGIAINYNLIPSIQARSQPKSKLETVEQLVASPMLSLDSIRRSTKSSTHFGQLKALRSLTINLLHVKMAVIMVATVSFGNWNSIMIKKVLREQLHSNCNLKWCSQAGFSGRSKQRSRQY